jgi:Rad3-related DNA helicase
MAVLDSRISSKNYGRTILDSLPAAPVTTDIHQATRFLAAHR